MNGRTHTVLCAPLRFVPPAVRAILFKLLTHALQAPMRVNVTSERILTYPGLKVKSGNYSKAVPSHEKYGN